MCVLVAIDIEHWNNDPVVVLRQVHNIWIFRRQQFIQKVGGSCDGDPLTSMNRRLNENGWISLNGDIYRLQLLLSIKPEFSRLVNVTCLCDNFTARIVRPSYDLPTVKLVNNFGYC